MTVLAGHLCGWMGEGAGAAPGPWGRRVLGGTEQDGRPLLPWAPMSAGSGHLSTRLVPPCKGPWGGSVSGVCVASGRAALESLMGERESPGPS